MSNFKHYQKIDGLIAEHSINTINNYFINKVNYGEWMPKDSNKTSKFEFYADPFIEVILVKYRPIIAKITGLDLEPTYSFSRIYQEGESLFRHVDRPSCEISVTVNVSYIGEQWPIWMQYKDEDPSKYLLEPGDAVVYKGCEVMHWRNELAKGAKNAQFMLHYVNKNLEYKYDKRERIGMNSFSRDG